MKINNSLDIALWEKIPCHCKKDDIEKSYPISECVHCKSQDCWDSVPQKDFTIKEYDYDEEGNVTGNHDKVINEITLVRGKFEDVIGWNF